ncbi:MAG TPA: four helix bundle protein [Pirellulales bacterium]|nr:four helix bundle protein [Pirellulales bacterium]
MIRNYRDLEVWQRAIDIACYRLSDQFPKTEIYGLTSQLRRAAVSVAANIAEGHGRRRTKEYLHHLDIAYGSLTEVETHLTIAARLEYLKADAITETMSLAAQIGRMLNGLIASLERRECPDPSAPES